MTSGTVMTLTSSDPDGAHRALYNTSHSLSSAVFLGPGGNVPVRAVLIEDTVSTDIPLNANILIEQMGFVGFEQDLYLGAGAFTVTLFKTVHFRFAGSAASAKYAVEIGPGINAGERNDIICSQFAGQDYQVKVSNPTSSTFITNSSLDYAGKCAIRAEGGGSVHVTSCHLEHSSDIDWWFHVSGQNTTLRIVNSQLTAAGPKTERAPFYSDPTLVAFILMGYGSTTTPLGRLNWLMEPAPSSSTGRLPTILPHRT